ncbi:MAG: hypothetical protein JXJ17_12605 [Anaerolineae bacterium]|nr:hypothetical protein [Anaerolineae bacterium]
MSRRLLSILILVLILMITAGCSENFGNAVSNMNANATRIAGGITDPENPDASPAETATPEPTAEPDGYYDLVSNPSTSLVQAWGRIYGLPSGTEFTIIADETQVAEFTIQTLQLEGWSETVRGGSASIALGQIRLDLALQAENGDFGSGSLTFQPTLDEAAQLHLNPRGAEFGGLRMPTDFIPALGDSVHASLTGAQTAALSKVTLSQLSLDNGVMTVKGTVR